MLRMIQHALIVILIGVSCVRLQGGDDNTKVPRLGPKERVFIHATGLIVKGDDQGEKLYGEKLVTLASKSSDDMKGNTWASDKDVVLKALASIEEIPELRLRYRASLAKLFDGATEETTRKKIFERIELDYTPEKVAEYRTIIRKADGQKLKYGALPWPLCIPLDCCK